MEMRVYEKKDDILLIEVEGEIIGEARFEFARFCKQEIEGGCKGIILNMEQCPMVDSVWIGIIWYINECLPGGVFILNHGRSLRYLLTITKTDSLFAKYDAEDEALDDMRAKIKEMEMAAPKSQYL